MLESDLYICFQTINLATKVTQSKLSANALIGN